MNAANLNIGPPESASRARACRAQACTTGLAESLVQILY